MNNNQRQEIFALIEYCKIYNYDISAFNFGKEIECPDLQSEKLDIGVECTSAVLQGEFEAIGKNSKVNKINDLTCFSYFVDEVTDPLRLLDIVQRKIEKLNTHYKRFRENALFIRVSSNFPDSNHFSMCKVEEFAITLSRASFRGEHKFNPIILSQLGKDNNSYCCFVIDTDDYAVVEHKGTRSLSKNEISIIRGDCT